MQMKSYVLRGVFTPSLIGGKAKARGYFCSRSLFGILNIVLGTVIVLLLIGQAVLVNHLNTIGFRLNEFYQEQNVLAEENVQLEAHVQEYQSLKGLESGAQSLGMLETDNYIFITDQITAVAKN